MTLKLKQNDNGIQKHHPRDKLHGSCVMLGQSSSPCWGGENQDRRPKERVSALYLDLAQQSAGGVEWRSTFRQRAPATGLYCPDLAVVRSLACVSWGIGK